MSLRKSSRDAIRKGIYAFGIVEGLHNGLVTVRLGHEDGVRLTNLVLIGETVEVGQEVKIDYSSGTPPTVLSSLQSEVVEQEIPESQSAMPLSEPDHDISCHVNQDWWPLETQFNEEPLEWHVHKFGGNGWAIPGYTGWDVYPYPDPIHWEYDNAEFIDKVEYYTEHVTIPVSGKYLVTAQINPYDIVEIGTAFALVLKCNGTPFAEKTFSGAHNAVATNKNIYALHSFEAFSAGDEITMEYYWSYDKQKHTKNAVTWWNSGNWSDRQFLTLNLWPGTG